MTVHVDVETVRSRSRGVRAAGPAVLPVLVLAAVVVAGLIVVDGFGTLANLRATLVLASFVGIASVGLTFVVYLGGIDISVPFVISVANVLVAGLAERQVPFWPAVGVALATTGTIGALNGLVSRGLGIHPLIVTLSTGTSALGAVLWWTDGFPQGSAPDGLSGFVSIGSSSGPVPLPPIVVFWIVIAVAAMVIERRTVFGKQVYALGAAPLAAEYALVRPLRTWTVAFAASGITAGAAGILLLGFTGAASGTVGDPYLFRTIAAIVVGGIALTGGSGSYLRTCVGAITLVALNTVLLGFAVPPTLVQVMVGGLIVVMVAVSGRLPHVRSTI